MLLMAALRIYRALVEQNQKRLKRSLNIHQLIRKACVS